MWWRTVPEPLRLFLLASLAPSRGVPALAGAGYPLRRLAGWVLALGLLRGALEGAWIYRMLGRPGEPWATLVSQEWLLVRGGPFLLVNAASALFLWLATAWTLWAAGRFLGGGGRPGPFLVATGVLMGWYPLIGLLNYLHLWYRLPALALRAAAFYQPVLGVGQLLAFAVFCTAGYILLRYAHNLAPAEATLAAGLPITGSMALYLASAAVLYRWAFPRVPMPSGQVLAVSNLIYLLAAAGLSLVLWRLAQRWEGRRGP